MSGRRRLPRIAIAGLSVESSTSAAGGTVSRFRPAQARSSPPARLVCRPVRWSTRPSGCRSCMDARFPAGRSPPTLSADEGGDPRRDPGVRSIRRALLDIHGAMSVVGMTDAEGDLAVAVREALGDDTLIRRPWTCTGTCRASSSTLDLHHLLSNGAPRGCLEHQGTRRVPPARATRVRAAPTRSRAARKAWIPVPVLLPGEKTSTRIKPANGIYGELPHVEALPGVLDAAIWVGYAWADNRGPLHGDRNQ